MMLAKAAVGHGSFYHDVTAPVSWSGCRLADSVCTQASSARHHSGLAFGVSRSMGKKLAVALVAGGCAAVIFVGAARSFLRARSVAQCNACLNHQAQIEGAKQSWAIDNQKT